MARNLSASAQAKKTEYDNKYKRENYYRYTFRISKIHDVDVIEKLNSVENTRQYILNLIRKDIESSDK